MTAGTQRQVRVVIEGTAREVSNRCGVLRVDLPMDDNGLIPTVMVNPEWSGVTVEQVAPAYNWQDGDAAVTSSGRVWVRDEGVWKSPTAVFTMTDTAISADSQVLRYQAGEA